MDAFKAASHTARTRSFSGRLFTQEEAQRTLPLVQRIVRDIVAQYRVLVQRQKEYHELLREGPSERLQEASDRRHEAADCLHEYTSELEAVGCEMKDFEIGLVDFPSVLDGREVYLCWQVGEARVQHWHEVDAGYSGRRLIPHSVGAGASTDRTAGIDQQA